VAEGVMLILSAWRAESASPSRRRVLHCPDAWRTPPDRASRGPTLARRAGV